MKLEIPHQIQGLPRSPLAKLREMASAEYGQYMRQVDLAKELGVHSVTVGMWETGQRRPGRRNIEKLAVVLNVSLETIVEALKETAVKSVERMERGL